jgi:hypothetical protein
MKAKEYALQLLSSLDTAGCVDFDSSERKPELSLDYLFGKARGKMFGVLVCENAAGEEVVLKAFSSCQYNGEWLMPGWVPPLLDLGSFNKIISEADVEIKSLTRQLEEFAVHSPERLELLGQRKAISQKLMKGIHELYLLHNFRGEKVGIHTAFCEDRGIPTGTGDCCGPKLLNYAAQHKLKPLGLSEFYYGKENKSGTKEHKKFYPCCKEKCQPILGFMLCGLEP